MMMRAVVMASAIAAAGALAVLAAGDTATAQVPGSPVCGDRLCSEAPRAQAASDVNGCRSYEGTTRTYYIAADEVMWDYAPAGINMITGGEFGDDEAVFVDTAENHVGSTYKKAVYRAYTDATFTEPEPRAAEWEHLGIMGPVIHAAVCDTIVVEFRNNAGRDYSMHPHGVFYVKSSEGARYNDGTDGAGGAIGPGGSHTYVWSVPPRAGPGPADPSSIAWMYHSHVDSPADTNTGLAGPMIISARGAAGADGRAADVDREVVSLFTVHDENVSHYLCDNVEEIMGTGCTDDLLGDPDFEEGNLMHGINGYVYGNQPVPELVAGERVRWYLIGLGTEVDLHTPHWHGQTVLWDGHRTDVVELMPASMKTVDMVPDNPGTWLFHCHVNDHISAGMQSLFTVS
ncbi:MAG: multicopper oxidase domain-containing protein [Nitrosopumilus sp.]|nr:multicopper oxidase domain-containing protein [Nitrosopumilus sp.]MDA7942940.1 multicopper oxidase domain-containing protein [Nitrosopumilus sp.]MDA7998395.1 multicopper oxidase domain-containing protein [Nitrosopumilus sp.]